MLVARFPVPRLVGEVFLVHMSFADTAGVYVLLEEEVLEDLLFFVDGLGVEVANDERAVCFVG